VSKKEFQALKGISVSLDEGKILGIVGANGSGKSTLLRAISGVFSIDKGSIDLFGNRTYLLSIGVGFNPQLSGRDNVKLSGLLSRLTMAEIEEKMEAIISFSEIGSFIDKPVHTYSSGMYSKLAFSIATEMNTEIILIDEVLSVGDERFSKKSSARMKELIKDDHHTVVIVSHALNTLEELCDSVLWIHAGEMKLLGEPAEVLAHYQEFMASSAK
jgi:ABC-type polysaccharide/polyol phosphate transport system ATPase subunit